MNMACPDGSTVTSHAPLRWTRGSHFATRGSLLWTTGTSPQATRLGQDSIGETQAKWVRIQPALTRTSCWRTHVYRLPGTSNGPYSALPKPDRTQSPRCGTGIGPDRDITGGWRDVDEPGASLPAVSLGQA